MDKPFASSEQDNGEGVSSHTGEDSPKKKLCILTKILCGCIVSLVAVYFSAIVLDKIINFDGDFVKVIGVILLVMFFVLPFLAIAALIRINLYPERLIGRGITFLILVIACLLNLNFAYMMAPRARAGHSSSVMCAVNLKGLGTALTVYAYDYDGYLPSNDWCDRLIEEADVSPRSFQCYRAGSEEGESDYCLNVYAAGKKMSELPSDMVLLFECRFVPVESQVREPINNRQNFSNLTIVPEYFTGEERVYLNRWNQVGGPELLAYDRHHEGCNFLFADGRSEFVKTPELANLKWDTGGTVHFSPEMMAEMSIPEPQKQPFVLTQTTVLLGILGGISVLVTLYVLIRYKTMRYFPFILIIAVFSSGTGMFFGNMSEEAYFSFFTDGTTGRDAGIVFGLLVGVCFAVLLANVPDRIKALKTFKGFAASVGMVTGFICSTLVHLALIIVNKETNLAGILIGIPYGVFAGAILGAVSGFILKKTYRPQLVSENSVEGATQ